MTLLPLQTACAALGIAYWAPLMAVRRRLLAAGPAPDYPITEVALKAWAARAKPAPAPSGHDDSRVVALEANTTALRRRADALESKSNALAETTAGLQSKVTMHNAMFERMKAEPMLAAWLAPK